MPGFWLGFSVGLAGGVILGLAVGIALYAIGQSRAVVPPAARPLVDCLSACAEQHPFGSPEFDRCVDECMRRKRGAG